MLSLLRLHPAARHGLQQARLQWSPMLALLCLLLAACNTLSAPVALDTQAASSTIRLSKQADRSQSYALSGATAVGDIYIFASAPKRTQHVQFYLDGQPVRRTQRAPHDLMGGSAQRARALETRTLSNGRHTLRATFRHASGQRSETKAIFTVANRRPTKPSAPKPPATATRWQPKPGLSWQWQLQGELDSTLAVAVYDIDLFDTPARTIAALQGQGKRVICYFSAGSFEPWRDDAGAFPAAVKGNKMDGWDELWLDVRNLTVLKPIMAARLDVAAQKGCDAVEPDNVDAYSNDSGFPLSGADQLAYNRFLAEAAHARGLAVGLKNDLEQAAVLEPHFDFAVNEECFGYNECELLTPFIKAGKAVFGAEYEAATADFCPVTNALNLDFIKKRYDLGVYREACR